MVRMVECVCLGERFCRCTIVIGFHFPKREESREEGRVPTAHAAPAHSSRCLRATHSRVLMVIQGFTFRRVLDRPAYLCSISCHNNNLEYDSACMIRTRINANEHVSCVFQPQCVFLHKTILFLEQFYQHRCNFARRFMNYSLTH